MKLTNFFNKCKIQVKKAAAKKTETATNNTPATPATPKTEPKKTTVASQTGQSILASQNRQLLLNPTPIAAPGIKSNTARNLKPRTLDTATPATTNQEVPMPNIKDYSNIDDFLKATENYNKAYESAHSESAIRTPQDKKLDEDIKRLDKENETIKNESPKGIKSSPWEQFQFRQFN